MSALQVGLIAAFYGFYASQPLILIMGPSSMGAIIGLVVGLMMGDPAQGVLVGAWIQLIFLGTVNYGGTKPVDQFAACIVAIPIALAVNLPLPIALLIATLLGAVSFPVDRLWKRINTTVWAPRIDRAVERLDYGEIYRSSSLYPMLVRFIVSGGLAFALIYFGAPAVEWAMEVMPAWLLTGLSTAGNLLPALGLALFVAAFGRIQQVPFFVVAFVAMSIFSVPTLAMAVFGLFLAFLSIAWTDADFFPRKDA